jgi:hypothetical protein
MVVLPDNCKMEAKRLKKDAFPTLLKRCKGGIIRHLFNSGKITNLVLYFVSANFHDTPRQAPFKALQYIDRVEFVKGKCTSMDRSAPGSGMFQHAISPGRETERRPGTPLRW